MRTPEVKITREQLDEFLVKYLDDAMRAVYPQRRWGMLSFIPTFEDYFLLQNKNSREWKLYPHRETDIANFKIKMRRAEMILKYWFIERNKK